MPYQYATESQDYSDYASGTVFYGVPGHPAFPIRLTSEIFQRCQAVRASTGATGRAVLYDPCCGAAYHLSTLAYLHWDAIGAILGSDIDPDTLGAAERNLGLLTVEGLDRRIGEIADMLATFGKASHAEALASAKRLRHRLLANVGEHAIPTRLFQADATDGAAIREGLAGTRPDIVISDIPYGRHASWRSADPTAPAPVRPLWHMLEALRPVLSTGAVVAVASDKSQKVTHEGYRRVDRFNIGKRRVVMLQPTVGSG